MRIKEALLRTLSLSARRSEYADPESAFVSPPRWSEASKSGRTKTLWLGPSLVGEKDPEGVRRPIAADQEKVVGVGVRCVCVWGEGGLKWVLLADKLTWGVSRRGGSSPLPSILTSLTLAYFQYTNLDKHPHTGAPSSRLSLESDTPPPPPLSWSSLAFTGTTACKPHQKMNKDVVGRRKGGEEHQKYQ